MERLLAVMIQKGIQIALSVAFVLVQPASCTTTNVLVEALQSHGTVPAKVSGDDVGCWGFVSEYSSASCKHLNSTNLGVDIHWCELNNSAGYAVMQSSLAAELGQDIFRIRLVGPTIELLTVNYCNKNLALAPYHLQLPGTYSAEVLHLHTNYSLTWPSAVQPPSELFVAHTDILSRAQPGQPQDKHSSTSPSCWQFDESGRWLYEKPEQNLVKTCLHEDYKIGCLPRSQGQERNKSGLTWWHPDCELHLFSGDECHKCFARKKVCLVGDSHMRFLWHFLKDLVEAGIRGLERKETEVQSSDFVELFNDPWGLFELQPDSKCSVILRNTGAWHVSYAKSRAGAKNPDLVDYAKHVTAVAASLTAARDKGARVIWMTTNGQPINLAVHGHKIYEHKDFRTDPLLLAVNRIANTIMAAHDIPVLDTWSMTSAVADISHDGAHFQGDVGFFITHRFLNGIC